MAQGHSSPSAFRAGRAPGTGLLILGISDEISAPGDIERVRRVSEIVAQTEW